jgi:hypothetical protein
MPVAPTPDALATILPGEWILGATSLPEWIDGSRRGGRFRFLVESTDPLVLTEEQRFTTPEGRRSKIVVTSRLAGEGFVSRGAGLRRVLRGRWRVLGVTEDASVLALRTERSRRLTEGVIVLVQAGADAGELRRHVAAASEELGLSPEDFASLGWIDLAAER